MPDAGADQTAAAAGPFDVSYTEAEWRKRLTPDQFVVLRQSGTERPFTSPLNDEHRRGTFVCAGCEREAFSSTAKFDSHTGWPSFWAPIEGAIGRQDDRSSGTVRSAIHCCRCGGHLGHDMADGLSVSDRLQHGVDRCVRRVPDDLRRAPHPSHAGP